jgi:hypothetical protein
MYKSIYELKLSSQLFMYIDLYSPNPLPTPNYVALLYVLSTYNVDNLTVITVLQCHWKVALM